MDLEQLRTEMAETGRVGIPRKRALSVLWMIGAILLGLSSVITLVDALQTDSVAGVVMGAVVLLAALAGAAALVPGLRGRPRVVVDDDGIRVGRQLASWSRIARIEPSDQVYRGVRQVFVRVQDADRRAVFHAPLVAGLPRHTLPRALDVRHVDLVAFLTEELARRHPLTDPAQETP